MYVSTHMDNENGSVEIADKNFHWNGWVEIDSVH